MEWMFKRQNTWKKPIHTFHGLGGIKLSGAEAGELQGQVHPMLLSSRPGWKIIKIFLKLKSKEMARDIDQCYRIRLAFIRPWIYSPWYYKNEIFFFFFEQKKHF